MTDDAEETATDVTDVVNEQSVEDGPKPEDVEDE